MKRWTNLGTARSFIVWRSGLNIFPFLYSDFIACGEPDVVDVKFEVGDCDDEIPFYYSCQVRASSQSSPLAQPSNALGQNEGRWSPASRTGAGWRHHVDFDFLAVASIKSVRLHPFATGMLETTAKTVLVLKGSGPDSFEEVGVFKSAAISFNETIQASASSYIACVSEGVWKSCMFPRIGRLRTGARAHATFPNPI